MFCNIRYSVSCRPTECEPKTQLVVGGGKKDTQYLIFDFFFFWGGGVGGVGVMGSMFCITGETTKVNCLRY